MPSVRRWTLPLHAIQAAYTSVLVSPTPHPVDQPTREAIARNPAVQLEQRLYEYALARMTRDAGGVHDLTAKLALLRAGATVVCTVGDRNCKDAKLLRTSTR